MRTIECIILEKEGSQNGLCPHLDAPGQKSVKQQPMKIFCSITPTNLGQLSKPGIVLESACPEDSKTVPQSLI